MSSFSWLRNVPRYGFAKVGSTMASSEDVWVPVFCYFEQSCYEYSCTFFFFFSPPHEHMFPWLWDGCPGLRCWVAWRLHVCRSAFRGDAATSHPRPPRASRPVFPRPRRGGRGHGFPFQLP